MIRKIVDYKKLSEDILNLLVEKFPDGYDDTDIITFKNAQGEIIEAVEIRTDDTIYLVKVGIKLIKAMEEFADEDENEDGFNNDNSNDDSNVDIDSLEEEI